MKKKLFIIIFIMAAFLPSFGEDFSTMTKLWCTMNYKHWAIGYAQSVGFRDVNFYLYLDDKAGKLYDEQKREIENAEISEREIKYAENYHTEKKTYRDSYIIDRYTGKAKVTGTIRHDSGKWANFTYENRDFEGFGQCAKYSEVRKF